MSFETIEIKMDAGLLWRFQIPRREGEITALPLCKIVVCLGTVYKIGEQTPRFSVLLIEPPPVNSLKFAKLVDHFIYLPMIAKTAAEIFHFLLFLNSFRSNPFSIK